MESPNGIPRHWRKRHLRVLAVEDGGFAAKAKGSRALLLGVVMSNFTISRLLISSLEVDGLDATERMIEMVRKGRVSIDLILLASISYGGFNLMDPIQIYRKLRIPVLVVNPEKPNNIAVKSALRKHFADWKKRFAVFQRAGAPHKLVLAGGKSVYFHAYGIPKPRAMAAIRNLTVFGKIPEPLRVAHMLAHELSKGYR